jgi:outer membrane protein assembly factor BamB
VDLRIVRGAVDSSPVVDDNAVYFGMRNGGLQALNLHTGESLWESSTVSYVLASVALDRGTIYSGSSDEHELIALNAATGESKWSFKTIGPVHASPSTDGKTVYAASGNHYSDENQGIVYAVDAETGKERWSFKTGGNIYSSPMVDKGVLYIGSDDGYLYAID